MNEGTERNLEKRAIELARPYLTFKTRSVEAEKITDHGRPVWRVIFRAVVLAKPPLRSNEVYDIYDSHHAISKGGSQ